MAGIRLMKVDELRQRLAAGRPPRLVDVREEWEFSRGHIPGSELVPLSQFMKRYAELPRDQEIVLVCESGNRSGQAAKFLDRAGYSAVHNLVGGMGAWRRSEGGR